jgi:prephenate dehydrogenase
VVTMSAAQHDRTVAFTSHLPQMLAWALASSTDAADGDRTFHELIGPGFRDLTRIAASDPEMWAQISEANATGLDDALESAAAWMAELRTALKAQDREALTRLFEAARRANEELRR